MLLQLNSCQMSDGGISVLAGCLPHINNIEEVYVTQNDIGPDGTKAVADALRLSKSLRMLDLSLNQIGSAGLDALAAVAGICTLVKIDLQSIRADDASKA